MNNYCLEVYSNEDFDLIEDYDEREEAKDDFFNEVEKVYHQLEFSKCNSWNFEQIDDTRFNIEIDTYKDRFDKDIISALERDLETILQIKDIASFSIENYKYS